MAMLLNLVALGLVLGLSWVGMMWLAKRVHRQQGRSSSDTEWAITRIEEGDPCPECDGVGARQRLGRLVVCPLCEGTGVVSTLH
ncbi:MAG: hypothetical protein ACE367_06445 [Acidimicrobiales bacterium]